MLKKHTHTLFSFPWVVAIGRQGSCLFSSWAASHEERFADFLEAGTPGTDEILGEAECVGAVRDLLDAQAAARVAALVACRRCGR